MSDRIAVMNGGRIEQIGGPREIYERPLTPFVADFIGSLNTLELRVDELVGGYAVMRVPDGRIVVPVEQAAAGDRLRVAVRPEHIHVNDTPLEGGSQVPGTIAEIVFLGMYTQVHVDTVAGRIVSHRLADEVAALEPRAGVTLSWAPDHVAQL